MRQAVWEGREGDRHKLTQLGQGIHDFCQPFKGLPIPEEALAIHSGPDPVLMGHLENEPAMNPKIYVSVTRPGRQVISDAEGAWGLLGSLTRGLGCSQGSRGASLRAVWYSRNTLINPSTDEEGEERQKLPWEGKNM